MAAAALVCQVRSGGFCALNAFFVRFLIADRNKKCFFALCVRRLRVLQSCERFLALARPRFPVNDRHRPFDNRRRSRVLLRSSPSARRRQLQQRQRQRFRARNPPLRRRVNRRRESAI